MQFVPLGLSFPSKRLGESRNESRWGQHAHRWKVACTDTGRSDKSRLLGLYLVAWGRDRTSDRAAATCEGVWLDRRGAAAAGRRVVVPRVVLVHDPGKVDVSAGASDDYVVWKDSQKKKGTERLETWLVNMRYPEIWTGQKCNYASPKWPKTPHAY